MSLSRFSGDPASTVSKFTVEQILPKYNEELLQLLSNEIWSYINVRILNQQKSITSQLHNSALSYILLLLSERGKKGEKNVSI